MSELIEALPKLTNGYNRAYSYLSRLIQAGTFQQLLDDCIADCRQLCLDVEQQQLLVDWRGLEQQSKQGTNQHDFVCLFQALSNFLGTHYLLGCLC